MTASTSSRLFASFVGFAGVMHFVRPTFFDAIVPRVLPRTARFWTNVSGAAELAVAAAVANPGTRRVGGLAGAGLLVAVFPANVQAALDARTPVEKAVTWARLPLQVPLIRWSLRVSRSA